MKLLKYIYLTILGILFVIPLSVYAKGYEIVSGDLDTIGSVVKIADEEFYVIGKKDETHVKLFAKYNLGVGKGFETPTYKQEESATARYVDDNKGSVIFSNEEYWKTSTDYIDESYNPSLIFESERGENYNDYAAYVYNEKSNIKQYIDKYVEYLNNNCVSVEGTLISREELLDFNCSDTCYNCSQASLVCNTEYKWLVEPSYWTGYAVSAYGFNVSSGRRAYPVIINYIPEMDADNKYHGIGIPKDITSNNNSGIRPVIILDISSNDLCTEDVIDNTNDEEVYENPPTGAFIPNVTFVILIISSIMIIIYAKKKSLIKKI